MDELASIYCEPGLLIRRRSIKHAEELEFRTLSGLKALIVGRLAGEAFVELGDDLGERFHDLRSGLAPFLIIINAM